MTNKNALRFLAALAIALLTSAVSAHAASPWEAATLRLELGMTEQATTSAVGVRPTSSTMRTCGQNSGTTFRCKMVIYGTPVLYGSEEGGGGIAAVYEPTQQGWRLVSWTALR